MRWSSLAVLALSVGIAHAEPPVELKSASFADVKAAIAKSKGKIVVIDVWATY